MENVVVSMNLSSNYDKKVEDKKESESFNDLMILNIYYELSES